LRRRRSSGNRHQEQTNAQSTPHRALRFSPPPVHPGSRDGIVSSQTNALIGAEITALKTPHAGGPQKSKPDRGRRCTRGW
jgi:hypothetical protein